MISMEIYGMQKDMEAFGRLLPERQERIAKASAEPVRDDPANALARRLHPERIDLVITEIREETSSTRTFRLRPAPGAQTELPIFRAGQYLSLKVPVGDSWLTRPYSIASAPYEAGGADGFYEIAIRRKEGGFLTGRIWESWRAGTQITASGPHGTFYYEPLRDSPEIVALAGGSGITPIRSMLREAAAGRLDARITILYGTRRPDDIPFATELRELAARLPEKIRVAVVCSEPDEAWCGPTGFLTAACIRDHAGDHAGKTFFLCGPAEMYRFLDQELAALGIPRRRIRREVFGEEAAIAARPGFLLAAWEKSFSLTVQMGTAIKIVRAAAEETILTALERAGLAPDSQCRSGECGLCRSHLVSGEVFIKPEDDGRREADRRFGFIHPCATYPLSDLEIRLSLTGAAAKGGPHFDAAYDCIVIGAGNGGLAAALKLAKEGVRVLLLEQHNLPGGFATSFVRGRFEFEPSLHELSNVGSPEEPGFVRKFLIGEGESDCEFVPVPEAYHLILTDKGVNLKIPFGIENFVETIAQAVPGSREPLEKYLSVCKGVFDGISYVGRMKGQPDGQVLMEQYPAFLATAGYTVDQVTRTFGFPEAAIDLIYPYWCYLGLPVNRLAFTIWALVLYDYLLRGAHVPRERSHGMSAAVDARIRQLGGRTEYGVKVAKILTEEGRVTGVETASGERIKTRFVLSNASPSLVYGRLIDPPGAVPEGAFKLTNARKTGSSAFVVYLGLDCPPEALNIESYGYFIGPDMDTEKAYENFNTFEPPRMQATICLNKANPGCSPPGTTILSMTALAGPDAWKDVKPEEYLIAKQTFARAMIDQFGRALNCSLWEHIEEVEIAAPPTFARYTGAFKGTIYAYEQDPWDSVVARALSIPQERFIRGLDFVGGAAPMGCGYESAILSGRTAAQMVLARLKRKG
ncbi:MAG: FAD-binding oxidoreductase [Syntrophales bacterium]|nr:FAD-binding oxidoreductase [Syntrophales bacterium]MDP3097374.1 FAD-binding oxidoreductase [Syntrophales bacterium]